MCAKIEKKCIDLHKNIFYAWIEYVYIMQVVLKKMKRLKTEHK
jgi:hypothetical protein